MALPLQRHGRRTWLRAALLACALGPQPLLQPARANGTSGTNGANGANGSTNEQQIKAAFLYKFLGFVEWPAAVFARPDAPLVVGVLGAAALGAELAQVVARRRVNGRQIEVRTLHAGEPLAGLHVLFIGSGESARAPAILARAKSQALLVVSESEVAFAHGSTINFLALDDKVRFDVALGPAEQAGLKISARLLAVARRVLPSPS